MLYSDLRRSTDMASRMEGDRHAVDLKSLLIIIGVEFIALISRKPMFNQFSTIGGSVVDLMPSPQVIPMSMGNDRLFHGLPRVQVEFALGAIDPF
jgi:hypothetical protein